jgi:hypothetical protein
MIVDDDLSLSTAQVQLSRSWPASTETQIVRADGVFSVPSRFGSAIAYLDVDGDGALDLYREPSTHCRRDERTGWECRLRRTRVIAHRVLAAIAMDGSPDPSDHLELIAERYLVDGTVDRAAQACVHGQPDLCAHVGAAALGPADSLASAVSPCQLDDRVPRSVPISIDLGTSDGAVTLDVPYPPSLSARVEVVRRDDSFVIEADADLTVTNAVLWYGESDASAVYWSTEQDPDALTVAGRRLTAVVPDSVLDHCTSCKLMLQMAHIVEGAGIGTYSEARFVIPRSAS